MVPKFLEPKAHGGWALGRGTWQLSRRTWPWGKAVCSGGFVDFPCRLLIKHSPCQERHSGGRDARTKLKSIADFILRFDSSQKFSYAAKAWLGDRLRWVGIYNENCKNARKVA